MVETSKKLINSFEFTDGPKQFPIIFGGHRFIVTVSRHRRINDYHVTSYKKVARQLFGNLNEFINCPQCSHLGKLTQKFDYYPKNSLDALGFHLTNPLNSFNTCFNKPTINSNTIFGNYSFDNFLKTLNRTSMDLKEIKRKVALDGVFNDKPLSFNNNKSMLLRLNETEQFLDWLATIASTSKPYAQNHNVGSFSLS